VYGIILRLSEEILEEVIPISIENIKGLKIVRGVSTLWKYNKYTVPIYGLKKSC
jgi:hypothetical protein